MGNFDDILDKYKKKDEGAKSESSEGNSFADKFSKSGKKEGGLSFVDQMVSKSGHLIYHITGKDATNGLDATYFLLVDKTKVDAFKASIGSDTVNLLDFGKIIASCYGKEPNDNVKSIMSEKYGFEV